MSYKVTLGGERLGGGRKNEVEIHGFRRSTHDLSYVWRSTMAPGTLVPFMSEVALPGDTFDINLDVDVMTTPTIGPLFGSFKVHLDVFFAPQRLYVKELMQNQIGIGFNMSNVFLPQIRVEGNVPVFNAPIDNQHVNPSCVLKYLGISGVGYKATTPNDRNFNGSTYLALWEIYKQYYANKQEANGAMVHINPQPSSIVITSATFFQSSPNQAVPVSPTAPAYVVVNTNESSYMIIQFAAAPPADLQISQIEFLITEYGQAGVVKKANEIFDSWVIDTVNNRAVGTGFIYAPTGGVNINSINIGQVRLNVNYIISQLAPTVYRFPLINIDNMKNTILSKTPNTAQIVNSTNAWPGGAPYTAPFQSFQTAVGPPIVNNYSMMFPQEGLPIRTYSSDLFNNWLDTAVIDGGTGITEVTKVNVVANKFTIDELNLAKKVYEMLNRLAISGGTYDDWLDTMYTNERTRQIQTPIYLGGLLRDLVFQEVVSTAATQDEPVGTLAGRGKMGQMKKGGDITAKIDEPGYLISLVSLVPRIDYSQGNKWDTTLKTMNDFHKPGLDEIGFQNLITDQMAWFDTLNVSQTSQTFRSAGKQPAWINYMTNVNKVYGAFADENQQMFMVLNRRYDVASISGQTRIADLTTYIDPSKYNHIFANTRLDAQNFWVQIGVKMIARRKMSAKVIPNL